MTVRLYYWQNVMFSLVSYSDLADRKCEWGVISSNLLHLTYNDCLVLAAAKRKAQPICENCGRAIQDGNGDETSITAFFCTYCCTTLPRETLQLSRLKRKYLPQRRNSCQ